MITPISEYEYLGNSLQTINSNMNELNIRVDNLFLEKEKWNELANTFTTLSAELNSFVTTVQTNSGNWKSSTDLVYNTRAYWEEPVQICYHKTFTTIANYLEIETWLNENFPSESFSPSQIMRCDFLCKNYNNDSLEGSRISSYGDGPTLEKLANLYGTNVNYIFRYLDVRNQMQSLLQVFNFLFRKYNKTSLILKDVSQIANVTNFVTFNRNTDSFQSSILDNFSQSDLKYFDSYVYQYKIVNVPYNVFVEGEFLLIPEYILSQFSPKNIYVSTGGRFFYKIINNKWTYYPYSNIEFCVNESCNDCYDKLDVNLLYKNRPPCIYNTKYILTECETPEPPYGSIVPVVELLSINDSESIEIISNLIS